MSKNMLETAMGAAVLLVAGGFFFFAYENGGKKKVEGYAVEATFDDISGIATGSDVRVGGMKIGVVQSLDLDTDTYEAVATLQIRSDVRLPKDSSAAVVSSGLLGDKFVKIQPGGDDAMIDAGGRIRFTQSSVSLEEMIGKFVFSGGGVDEAGSDDASGKASDSLGLGM